jgi:hypothetical protein
VIDAMQTRHSAICLLRFKFRDDAIEHRLRCCDRVQHAVSLLLVHRYPPGASAGSNTETVTGHVGCMSTESFT